MKGSGVKRGALIVFEGCDKAGKTTQCLKLVEKLSESGFPARMMQLPDRTTATGKIISDYLTKKVDLPDQAIHLLFSANRWEIWPHMKQLLGEGVTLVFDRYSYSGVAYSAAKPGMDFDWCQKPEIGFPRPDLVFLMHVPSDAMCRRSGFGSEIYENKEFLQKVSDNFFRMKSSNWTVIDGSRGIEELHEEILRKAKETIEEVELKDLRELW